MKTQIMIVFLGLLVIVGYANGYAHLPRHALATMKKFNQYERGSANLTISETEQKGMFVARLSGVKRGVKYIVLYGNDAVPLFSTTLEDNLDVKVGLVVPSLDQLKGQPVTVEIVSSQEAGKTVPYARGSFTYVGDDQSFIGITPQRLTGTCRDGNCARCSSTRSVCCSTFVPDNLCCQWQPDTNDNCRRTNEEKMIEQTMVPQRAVATLKKVDDPGFVTLTISQTDEQGVFVARLSNVKQGKKYIVMYKYNPVPLLNTSLENDLDTKVTLMVPSLEKLKGLSITVMEIRVDKAPILHAWGKFTVE